MKNTITARKVLRYILCLGICLGLCICMNMDIYAAKDKVIAIDAGHGGENLGADYNGMIEKDATLKVAKAMKEELDKYEGVTSFLIRTDDSDIEIDDRVGIAAPLKPDLIVSLHFNMSEEHTENGSEMWVSSRNDLYNKAFRFAAIELNLLEDYGLKKRGVFIRTNSNNEDFYGIIRYACNKGIPAVIVEHCYFDNEADEGYYETNKALQCFGKIDATAIAMTYRLKSQALGADYSSYKSIDVDLPSKVIMEDTTPPSQVEIALDDYDENTGILQVYIDAYDDESCITSCYYSFDGGDTLSEEIPWNGESNMVVDVPVKNTGKEQRLRFYVKNSYGLSAYSNPIEISKVLWDEVLETTTISVSTDTSVMAYDSRYLQDPDTEGNDLPRITNTSAKHLKVLVPVTTCLAVICLSAIFIFIKKH